MVSRPLRMGRVRGFTLIELMIVCAVVAILAAIAYPSYQESVRKSKRAEARTALLQLMQQQERYMTQMNTYLSFLPAASGTPFKTYVGSSDSSATYQLSAAACASSTIAQCVTLSATPKAGVFSDPYAGTSTLDSTGAKSCTGSDMSRCW